MSANSSEPSLPPDYRVPSAESFLPGHEAEETQNLCSEPLQVPRSPPVLAEEEASSSVRPVLEEISDHQPVGNLCWELLALAERLADDGAPDRAALKEELFLFKQKLQAQGLPRASGIFRRATPHTARLLREQELPSASSLQKFPISQFPDFDFPRIREFLAQHTNSRYTVSLLRSLLHHCTWKFLEISDRRAFLLALVAFDFLGGTPAVFARLLENSGTSEIFVSLVSVLACEWAGRAYLARFPLLPLVQNFLRSPVDSPVFIHSLAALQRLSHHPEIGNFFLQCQLQEFLVTHVLATAPMHSEFSREFSLALISNLAILANFEISESSMAALKNLLRSEISTLGVFRNFFRSPGLRDLAFAVGVDAELDRLAVESEIPENFRSVAELLHSPSREASAEKISDSPALCFLEDEELAHLVIGNSLAKDTFVTKRFLGSREEDRNFFENFLASAIEGTLVLATAAPKQQAPALEGRAKPKIWR